MRCAAVTDRVDQRCQQTWRKDCESRAAQIVCGVPLCLTHINALARGPIAVRTMLDTPPELARSDASAVA